MTNPVPTAETNSSTLSALERWGRRSWFTLGILGLGAVVFVGLASLSGLIVPLVVAVVIGTLATPIVDWMEDRRVPRPLGASLTILGLVALVVGSIALAANGILDEGDEISRQLTAGVAKIDSWLQELDIDLGVADDRVDQAGQFGVDLLPGLAAWLTTAFSSAVSFVAGSLIALFLLYFILADWQQLRHWLGRNLGVPTDLGESIIDDTSSILRQGFYALTISSVVTAVLIGATMLVLGVPLAFTVALVTFVTSYVPYLGAIFSATFACLVALGSGGGTDALILLVVILVVQNLVQTVISTKLTSDRLSLHPIASFASTIVGASVAGLLGATLSAPVLASVILVRRRVLGYRPANETQG